MKPIVDSLKVLGESTRMFESLRDNLFAPKGLKFNSQICTNREQSERILALGIKPETADMVLVPSSRHDGSDVIRVRKSYLMEEDAIPAWSLHRLIEMISEEIQTDWESMCLQDKVFTKRDNLYDNIIDCIEWLIKGGYFNKEYLEEKK